MPLKFAIFMAAPILYMRIGQFLMKHRVFILLSLFCCSCLSATSANGKKPWLEHVQNAIETTMSTHLEQLVSHIPSESMEPSIHIAYIDPRLNLSICTQGLIITPPKNLKLGRSHIKVSCQGQKPWAINVPVDLNVTTEVVVLNQPVPKGTKLTRSHLGYKRYNLASLHSGYFLTKKNVIGKQSKRSLPAQSILNNHLILPALLIYKGDRVMIMANKIGMSVKMSGEALNNGREGRQIRVRNSRSKRIIKGKVVASGLVEVNF